jgi:hypothetical protein
MYDQQGIKALISRVEPATRLLSWFYQLNIALLTDYHHDRIKGDMERVVMHYRVSLNSYNINAQGDYKAMIVIKQNPNGVVCTSAYLCSERKLVFSWLREG